MAEFPTSLIFVTRVTIHLVFVLSTCFLVLRLRTIGIWRRKGEHAQEIVTLLDEFLDFDGEKEMDVPV